jgi:hypothetical protein
MPARKKASAPAAPAATPASTEPTIEIPFDHTVNDLHLDMKGLLSLPADSEMYVKTLRAFVLPKGKYVHQPGAAGRYAVLGKVRTVVGLMRVHFKQSNRAPEMLLSISNPGDDSGDTLLETVPLPLQVSNGVFQSRTLVVSADNISGFSNIEQGSAHVKRELAPYLKKQYEFRLLKIESGADMLAYIQRALGPRLEELQKFAGEEISANVASLARQSADEASALESTCKAAVARFAEWLTAQPVEAYDAPVSTRFATYETLDAAPSAEQTLPAWLSSPLKAHLKEGTAAAAEQSHAPALRRSSRLSPGRAQGGAREAAGGGEDAASDADSARGDRLVSDDDEPAEEDDDGDDASVEKDGEGEGDSPLPLPHKRKRAAPDHYVAAAARGAGASGDSSVAPKAKGGRAAKAGKAKAAAASVDVQINPRTGLPYVRKPYNSGGKGSQGGGGSARTTKPAAPTAPKAGKAPASGPAVGYTLATALARIAELEAKLAGRDKDVQVATLETKVEYTGKYNEGFIAGLEKGLAMGTGQKVSLGTPASAI